MTLESLASAPRCLARSANGRPKSPLVRVQGVWHKFGEGTAANVVLKNNNLELYSGEIVIMTGQSGSGKTTLLTLIGGLRRLQKGSIQVMGRELFDIADEDYVDVRRGIGFIFQGHNLFGSLTVLQNVRLALELPRTVSNRNAAPRATNRELDDRAIALLEELELGDRIHYKPHQLSGGQRQRVAIARALAHGPELILADEPTAALDATSADIVVRLFEKQARQQKRTIIVVTHDEKILRTADRIVQMKYGEILANIHVARATEICGFLQNSTPLKELAPGTLSEMDLDIANRMLDEHVHSGTAIVRQGELGDKFYIIRRGEVSVLRDHGDGPREIARLGEGDYFGEVGLLRNEPRNATVVANTDVDLFALNKRDFDDVRSKRSTFEQQLERVLISRL